MDYNIPRTVTTRSGELPISIPLPDQRFQTAAQHPSWFRTCSRMLHHVHVGTLLVVYASLVGLVQLKFQSEKESAFQTHSFFMFMSVAGIIIFALSFWILDYTNENPYTNHFSSPTLLQMILVIVALFSIILAPLSLVLVLLLPPKLMWIGYSTICLLVLAIIAYTSTENVASSLGKNMHTAMWKLLNYIKDKY